ncbi:MAG: hypothetical protein WDN00_06445 [Limisphaerales bacterium]
MIGALVVLTGVYVFFFTDWFKPKIILITSASRVNPMRPARNTAGQGMVPVTFSVTPQSKLTEITVGSAGGVGKPINWCSRSGTWWPTPTPRR